MKHILLASLMITSFSLATLSICTETETTEHANYCVICNTASTFKPFGNPKRKQAQCRYCGSLERHRTLFLYLKNHTNIFSDKLNVLHFSPSPMIAKKLSQQPNLRYITADIRGKHVDLNLDITDIKLPDASFDIIICYHVLEHIVDDKKAMEELKRILKPGGFALAQVPWHPVNQFTLEDKTVTSPAERLRLYGQSDHVRYYGQADFEQRLINCGFAIERADAFLETLDQEIITKSSLSTNAVYKCFK